MSELHLLNALVKELQADVAVAHEGALLDELREHLGPRQLDVELLLGPVPGLQEPCREEQQNHRVPLIVSSMLRRFTWLWLYVVPQ